MNRLAHFFIGQPVLAAVLSLLIVLAGCAALFTLPVTEYPSITPPEVTVRTELPGASASVLEKSVAVPIEERVNGAKDMLYMSSRLSNDGSYTLQLTFKPGSDPATDAAEVENRVHQAESSLPADVLQNGVIVKKRTPTTLAIVSLSSPGDTFDSLFASNYMQIHMEGPLVRSKGVGDYELHGRTYAMRLWLDPMRMAGLGVTAEDVSNAVLNQSTQTPPGQIGSSPATPGTLTQYDVTGNNQMTTASEFNQMIVRHAQDGSVLRLRDFGHAELGPRLAGTFTDVSGHEGASLQLYEAPGGNALDAVNQVRKALGKLTAQLPAGLEAHVTLDTTLYIRQSIREVIKTFLIALVLVLAIVYLFLGSFRATLIPMAAVPVSLIGSLGVFAMLKFSLNLLSLFGLVLAVGLVVDDAIIVVEAVQRHIEDGDSPADAAGKAMDEVSRAILAIAMVLSFVFIPIAFIPGITGSFYRQFSLAIAASVLISAFVALSLTPALCSVFLKPQQKDKGSHRNPLTWLTEHFDSLFERLTTFYARQLDRVLGRWKWTALAVALVTALTVLLSFHVPEGFIPSEDQGYFYLTLTLPDATSLARTQQISRMAEQRLLRLPGLLYINTLGGYTFLEDADQSNTTTFLIALKPWGKRTGKGMDAHSLSKRAAAMLADIPDAEVTPQEPAAVPGLGGAGGFTFELQNERIDSISALADVAEKLSREAAAQPELDTIYNTVRVDVPQIDLAVDRDKASALGISALEIFETLQMQLGGLVVNNFNRFGRIYKTVLQADSGFRADPGSIRTLQVRSSAAAGGAMVPLSAVTTLHSSSGPNIIQRFDMYPNVEISGGPAKGYSSGQALARMEALAKHLPPGYGFHWSGMAYQEHEAKGKSAPVFVLALVFIYLVMSAQFGSWLEPMSILVSIPTGAFGVFLALWIAGLDDSIYAQIGLVAMIGLTAKNAVLIAEFANQRLKAGGSPRDAGAEAARLRFRPILMTSLAFILGMLPLVFASGAEAVSRRTLGVAVLGGMVMTTLLTVFVTPVFWVAIEEHLARRSERDQHQDEPHGRTQNDSKREGPADQGASA